MINRIVFVLLLASISLYSLASIQVYKFEDPRKEQQFNLLVQELRCPKCQNNNLADSNSELSIDLKTIIYEKVVAGESNEQIVDYLKERYGDFISYRPPVKPSTWFIWFGPFIVLALACFAIYRFLSGRKKIAIEKQQSNVSDESKALLDSWNDELETKADDVDGSLNQ